MCKIPSLVLVKLFFFFHEEIIRTSCCKCVGNRRKKEETMVSIMNMMKSIKIDVVY